ncbi:putative GEM-like protein 8 [Arachis ipaensis]|uniref:GEM-like protein n=1 Tax=Arachis hypogaea TaxID=3818 RepID=A0A6B9VEP4_ARAHY|nr:putative GEM-like protein 8 [Arachis ipaensis]XP_025675762.1 putative GEM-like protein 8 [Arachis hypogaea]QHN79435.1 GEM-like protein [Arachis hypogaea]
MQTSSLLQDLFIGNPIISAACDQLQKTVNRYYLPDPVIAQSQYSTKASKQSRLYSIINKLVKKADSSHSQGVQEHVRLGTKISETVKEKLRLGAHILQVGGVEKVFKQFFRVKEGERLLKASPCYLSTTSGPLAGLLFVSTNKVAFCSDRSMKVYSREGQMCRIRYKVVIPLKKVKCVNQSESIQKPKQKFIEIDTVDNYEFWFMGVLQYQKTFKYLEQAISQAYMKKESPF